MSLRTVVIVGGGFGGLACARKLDGRSVNVVLLDAHIYHLFTPLLYEVASALLNPSDISYPYRARFRTSRNVRFRQALVTSVDFQRKRIRTQSDGVMSYDYLVLATGSTNNYFGNEGLANFSIGMKTLEEALQLRNHVLSCLERASETNDASQRRRWLTFVIVGGGPTGVEYVGALLELLKLVLGKDFPNLTRASSRVVLVEGQDRLLPGFAVELSRYTERTLSGRGAEIRTGTLVERATGDRAVLSDGESIETRTIVWSAGVRPNDEVVPQETPRSRPGRLQVAEDLRLHGFRDVFAIGDLASAQQGGSELPMLAPVAMQQGRYVARSIGAELDRASGEGSMEPKPFRYVDKGMLATIGRNAAVAQIGRLRLTGFIGWLAWLLVHIYYLVGFRNRLVVLASWGWTYFRKDRPIRIVVRAKRDPVADDPSGS
ncbi:MAG: NAD(P)/FAD-dependent oxidoreductase [Actinomycetota bacterium]